MEDCLSMGKMHHTGACNGIQTNLLNLGKFSEVCLQSLLNGIAGMQA